MKNAKTKLLALVAMFAAVACTACNSTGPPGAFPLPVAVGYRVPDTDLVVAVRPDPTAAKGYALTVSGSYKGLVQTADGWEFTSPKRPGITYRVHTAGPAPYLEIVGTGDLGGGVVLNPPDKPPAPNPLDVPQP